ncbi:bifunctional 3-(3-hydroxy-phenyl)propionate/3-hydroxycinnamic acid hydroxylase [Ideonella sp. 4Y11]|uniref:Bifunctional 3-(3-hydroxy-phenyl)propionate/3-hydroxycinnamic acid hydroxylase n=1 Tax=Ideonella aquatica TaxID=2824119 RepID=A0A941BR24_9BURK|nr:bifunctional 3-(3-hydroxy-phenyl)propionate/3-hydroxycinnamic acid hydroxylase [Ideonella aquatica]MBQ0959835.1 bifunctional 3-(3-hydroxy-phenyl)propionate/3-hydroxycinnamic acid hydroxylase [Ideonella aquatica]
MTSFAASRHADVLVIGLGPTGATLAGLLARRGLRVAVFDRLPDLYPLPRAIGLDHEALRIWQSLGLAEALAPHIAPYRPSEYRGVSGQLIKRLDMAPPPHQLGWAPNWVFDQPAVERVLRQHLAAQENVHIGLAHEVLTLDDAGGGVTATVRDATGHTSTWTAAYAVACDGGASPVRKRLGITLEDLQFDEPWLVVDAHVRPDKLAELPQTQVQYCEPARPSTFVVGPGTHRRWELMLLPGEPLHEQWPEETLWPLLARWIRPGEATLWRAAAYRFHGLVAQRWRAGRILLAGDAAHMTPPFMAQGMVQGLRDAANLAWKLERVLRYSAPEALLDSYETERRPHVVATTRAAMALGRVICERDPVKAAERDARLLAEHGGTVPTTVRQSMLPDLSAGLIAAGSPGAGSLFPQPRVRSVPDGDTGWLDDVGGGGVRVLAGDDALTPADVRAFEEALSPLQGRLLRLIDPAVDSAPAEPGLLIAEEQSLLVDWLRGLGARFAIVRPDHQVYATAASVPGALRHLAELAAAIGFGR